MLASHAWLKRLTGLDLDPREVAARLTAAGIEVEAMREVGGRLERVVIAEVRATRPHPKRDKLRLVRVFDGDAEHEVVCGAHNVPAAGGRVVLARLGAKLPSGLEIAERELGGVVSRGMLCSERELDAGSDESGILVLETADTARAGAPAGDALGLRDTLYELSLTPNRPDCLGHVGLARELCALFAAPFRRPSLVTPARLATGHAGLFPQREAVFELWAGAGSAAAAGFSRATVRIDIAAGERCPRYGAALVSGLEIGPSPFWLRLLLHRLGLRAISNVVDATNYVLMLFGHPIHAFDYALLRGGRIEVRLAREGERMRTLDGEERELCPDDLLICDAEGPVALAGVMGGENSQIGERTRDVLIECAYFDPRSVRRTSKRTGLHTDSSHRFERGVDPEAVPHVLAFAAALIAELGRGAAVAQALDVIGQRLPPRKIRLRDARVAAVLGIPVAPAVASARLLAIGCALVPAEDSFEVTAPTHRPDITREIDLIEEIARLGGYDALPSALPSIIPSAEGTPQAIHFQRRLRQLGAAAGLNEAVNYAFVAPSELRHARASESALRIVNPLSEERSAMRTSLLPGLAANLRAAQRQQQKSFASFELARVFHPRSGQALPEERHQFGLLLWGERRAWYKEGELFDFYDAKAAIEAVVRPLAGRPPSTVLDAALERESPELHPRRRARVLLGDRPIGALGELHPEVARALELDGRPIWAQFDLMDLAASLAALGSPKAEALPRYPSSTRDVAVVVSEALAAGEVADALREAAGLLAESVALFDIYRGDPVPAGQKSLAFHVVYRDPEATLTDKIVDGLHARVVAAAEVRFGGLVRR